MRRLALALAAPAAFIALAAPSCLPPPAAPIPVGQTGAWPLLFADEFNGTALDTSKWVPSWHNGANISPPVNSAELSCYDPRQVTISNGALVLTLQANSPARAGCRLRSGSAAPLASGLVESDGKFNGFTAGTYAEARVHLAPGSGTPHNWPAFWSDGQHWPADGEIDVMEVLSGGTTRWHVHDSNGGPGGGPTLAAGWHTFAAWRHSTSVDFYWDGARVGGAAIATRAPHYLIANLGQGTGSVKVAPSNFLVDYVRVWKEPT